MVSLSIRSDTTPIDPSFTADYVQQTYLQNYLDLAMLVALVYHTLITLDKEVYYFWKTRLSTVNCIFFLNQFVGLVGAICFLEDGDLHLSVPGCFFVQWVGSMFGEVTILLIDYILLLRVLALYSHHKRLSAVLKLLFVAEVIVILTLAAYANVLQSFVIGELPFGLRICGTINTPPFVIGPVCWAIPLAYGLLLMILALRKGREVWKETQGIDGTELIKVLLQDQVIYFTMVIFCCVVNIVAAVAEINTLAFYILYVAGSPTLLCILGRHLLINLKEAGEKGFNEGTNYWPTHVSTMDFARSEAGDILTTDFSMTVVNTCP